MIACCPNCGHHLARTLPISALQMNVLRLIQRYTAKHGYAPLHTEMAAELRISLGGLQYHLRQLRAAGHIQTFPAKNRGIIVLVPAPEPT